MVELSELIARLEAATGPDRFWSKVDKSAGEHECWNWTASTNQKGYGQFSVGSRREGTYRMLKAHRVAFLLSGRSLADDTPIDHTCRNRRCVNPQHLEAVSTSENNKRAAAAQSSCFRGHPFTPANTIAGRNGTRECRECRLERKRRYRRAV